MAIRNRNTLIEGFSKGQRPTADDFKNLIDSTVNILDDGFSKDAQSGIKLAPMSEQDGTVMTFLQNMTDDGGGRWEFDILNNDMKISRVNEKEKYQLILLKQTGEIEFGEEGCDINVKGTLHAEQRSGKNSCRWKMARSDRLFRRNSRPGSGLRDGKTPYRETCGFAGTCNPLFRSQTADQPHSFPFRNVRTQTDSPLA